tara:strand:- start:1400 stop:1681 length:282 start_codon:yes stop_codon:yes gene_type:complete
MDKEEIAISVIAKELECNAYINGRVLDDIYTDKEYVTVGTMLKNDAVMAQLRFRELYDKHLRSYAIAEYHDRMNTESQRKIHEELVKFVEGSE